MITDDTTTSQNQGFELNQVPKISSKDLKVAAPIALAQSKAVLAVSVSYIQFLKTLTSDPSTTNEMAKGIISQTLGRLLCNLEELAQTSAEDQELKKAIVM